MEYTLPVCLEVGQKKVFANVIEWPGWGRNGATEEMALQALLIYAPRYAKVVKSTGLDFHVPADLTHFNVVERLRGGSTTDFGAFEETPSADREPMDEAGLANSMALIEASWEAFEAARAAAQGKTLRKGPRGGGRELDGILEHVLGAAAGYLSSITWKLKLDEAADPQEQLRFTRQAVAEALTSAVRNGLPERGPRGGKVWKPRYFVRRLIWHILDHVWEIEDRME